MYCKNVTIIMSALLTTVSMYSMDVTCLHKACIRGNVAAVTQLIRDGADKEAKNCHGNTPLLLACMLGHAEIVDQLIQAGANNEAKNGLGDTPLHIVCMLGHTEIAERLLRASVNKEAQDDDGNTALHWACLKGDIEIVELLLRAGADHGAQDYGGYTPLHEACIHGHITVAERLLQAGADITIKNDRQQTAFDLASMPAIKELIKHHAQKPSLAFVSGQLERLGAQSPVSLLARFDHMTKFIVQHACKDYHIKKEDEKEPELL